MGSLFRDVVAEYQLANWRKQFGRYYEKKHPRRDGLVMSSGGVAVGGQCYPLNGARGAAVRYGEMLDVHNLGRVAAAHYVLSDPPPTPPPPAPPAPAGLTVSTVDGNTLVNEVKHIVVTNGTLDHIAKDTVEIDTGGGGGGGEGELIYSMPGIVAVGSGGLVMHNRTSKTLHISEVFLSVGTPPTGSGLSVSVSGIGSVGVGAGGSEASNEVDVDWAPGSTFSVSITAVGSGVPGGNLVIHLPYTYE